MITIFNKSSHRRGTHKGSRPAPLSAEQVEAEDRRKSHKPVLRTACAGPQEGEKKKS